MGMTKAALVVADAGPLIHLDELAALDVIGDFSAVIVPDAVWREVQQHRPQALSHPAVKLLRQPMLSASAQVNAVAALYTLHQGEREALALCLQQHITLLLTDDTAARLAAKNLNINAHGTLGLLIRAVRKQHRSPAEVLALLAAIPAQSSLHIRPSLLNDVIAQVKAEWMTDDE
ncbi:hypothetical protein [Methylomonas koyamae]|nr:hypothetical protein [Methylomonas koyamae]BBL58879.1 hypothetical protein MKFW12EY_24920 [Methylomonas koyamae]